MKHPSLKFLLLVALFAGQLAVPALMIHTYENTLKNGEAYLFKVVPIDPADPFRGRYVWLRFAIERTQVSSDVSFSYRDHAFAQLSSLPDGLTQVDALSKTKPETGNFIKVRVRRAAKGKYYIDLPIDRYYANEHKAPEIERAVWQSTRPINNNSENGEAAVTATASVKIKDGLGVIEQLYIDGTPIEDYLKTH